MQQQIHQQSEQSILEENNQWQAIYDQLQRIDVLNSNLLITNINVNKLKQEVNVIKKVNDIDQRSQGELDKQQNTIDKDSIPSTLTSSEKKRYENIGAQFVKGAGKQFDKIKKAIQFKEKMKTSQNEKFIQDVKKNKQNVKKQIKKSNFWTKLLAVMGVLGLVAILLRDKIAKMIPDFSKSGEQFGSNIVSTFTGLVKHFATIAIKFIGGGIANVIDKVCVDIIPDIIRGFFHDTLPIAMVAATLSVLSLFSDSAGAQLQSIIGQQSKDKANSTESRGQQILSEQAKQYAIVGKTIQQLKNGTGGLDAARRDVGNALFVQKNGLSENDPARVMIDDLAKKLGKQSQFQRMIATGRLNVTSLYQSINEINRRIPASDILGRQQAYYDTLVDHLLSANDEAGQQKIKKWVESNVTANGNIMEAASQAFLNNKTYSAILNALNRQATNRIGNVAISPELETTNQTMSFVTHINVQQAMLASFADGVNDVLFALDSFLNGKDGSSNFLKSVQSYFVTLQKQCTQFFTKNYVSLYKILQNAIDFFGVGNISKSVPTAASPSFVIQDYGKDGNEKPFLWNTNVMVLNVQVSDIHTSLVGRMLYDIHSVDKLIKGEVEKSITTLDQINKKLSKQIVIKNGSGSIDFSATLKPINDTLDKHGKSILSLEKNKMDKPQGDTGGNSKPPRGTQT